MIIIRKAIIESMISQKVIFLSVLFTVGEGEVVFQHVPVKPYEGAPFVLVFSPHECCLNVSNQNTFFSIA